MDHLKRARSPKQRLDRGAESLASRQQQRGPKPFAARKDAPAYRLMNFFGRRCRRWQKCIELDFNQRATTRQQALEFERVLNVDLRGHFLRFRRGWECR